MNMCRLTKHMNRYYVRPHERTKKIVLSKRPIYLWHAKSNHFPDEKAYNKPPSSIYRIFYSALTYSFYRILFIQLFVARKERTLFLGDNSFVLLTSIYIYILYFHIFNISIWMILLPLNFILYRKECEPKLVHFV